MDFESRIGCKQKVSTEWVGRDDSLQGAGDSEGVNTRERHIPNSPEKLPFRLTDYSLSGV